MRVVARLYLVYAVLLACLLAVGGVALWSVQSWHGAVGTLRGVREQTMRAERLRGDLLHQLKEMFEHRLLGDLDAEQEVDSVQERVEATLTELRRGAHSAEEVALVDDLETADDAIVAGAERFFREMAAQRLQSARAIVEDELDETLFPRQMETLDALSAFYRRQLEQANGRTLAANKLVGTVTTTVLLLVLGAGVALLAGSRRWLVLPLDEIVRSIAVIGTGNLGHRVPVRAPDELGTIAAEINRMAAALGESQERLVESQRLAAVGELSGYVAHNIRNPLAAVRSAAQLGLDEASDLERTCETFRDIISSVDKLEGWVRQLLVYSGPLHLARTAQEVDHLVREVLALLRPSLEAKGVRVELRLDAAARLPLDERQLEQALAAIVGNALDACRSGGRLAVRTQRMERALTITVDDDGEGMTPEVLEKVFQPYFTTKPTGVGLGLPMARRIVEAHGGSIEIASARGAGTTVTITLPD